MYGSKKSFEWGFTDDALPYITTLGELHGRGRETSCVQQEMPNFYRSLPQDIQKFTVGEGYDPLNPQESLKKGAGGGHHGSHPHLVHEFVMSIIQGRKSWIDEVLGGNITAAGICAHESAMNNGREVIVPAF